MKAAERRRKRLQEKQKLEEAGKKKLISIPLKKEENLDNPENFKEINNENKIQNVAASRPANNMDIEKISQRIRERKEKRRKKNLLDSGVIPDPVFVDKNSNKDLNENINEIKPNTNNDINKNLINEKDSNKLLQSLESMAPLVSQKKVNFNIPSNKTVNINNILDLNNNSNINRRNSNGSSIAYSINNNNDALSVGSIPNYHIFAKKIPTIKNENVEDFLKKTNPDKPLDEQKESEVKRMVKVMNLHPNPKNANNKEILNDENNYVSNLTQKIEDNYNYYENQKEIKELRERVKEEEEITEQKLKRNKEEIQKYIEKILSLQNNLINSKQGDIVALEEENKIYEIQINNYQVTLQRLEEENEKEKKKMHSLINEEIIPLQKELKTEINEVRNLKNQLKYLNKKVPPKDILKKIDVVMKYMKHCT